MRGWTKIRSSYRDVALAWHRGRRGMSRGGEGQTRAVDETAVSLPLRLQLGRSMSRLHQSLVELSAHDWQHRSPRPLLVGAFVSEGMAPTTRYKRTVGGGTACHGCSQRSQRDSR